MKRAKSEPAINERIIVALDYPDEEQAKELVRRLGEHVRFYKVGLEIFMSGDGHALLRWLLDERQCRVFVDLKFFDVPNTVGAAVARLAGSGAEFITVHGNDAMLRAAVSNKGERLKVLAVTALSSLDQGDLSDLGFQCDFERLALSRARRAVDLGCDGVIASGRELTALRSACGRNLLIITPGVRPSSYQMQDDQKRTVSPEEAFRDGADYIVVGRPISRADNPEHVVRSIQNEVKKGLAGRRYSDFGGYKDTDKAG